MEHEPAGADIALERADELGVTAVWIELEGRPVRAMVEGLDHPGVVPSPVIEHLQRKPRIHVLDGVVVLGLVARPNPDETTEAVAAAYGAAPVVVGRRRKGSP